MIDITRILCPTDFSDFSRLAFDHAIALARRYGASVTLLHVVQLPPVAAAPAGGVVLPSMILTPADREALLANLRQFAEREGGGGVRVDVEVLLGTPAAEILAFADARDVDLMVLGTHGLSGFERLVLGSVAEKVVRKATCPVLTVPAGVPDAAPASPVLFRQVLCPVDFSDCSMRALEYAISLAEEADAHLTLLHVLELPPDIAREAHENAVGPGSLRDYIVEAEKDRLARLQMAVPDDVRAFCTVDTAVTVGTAWREILRVAAERKADVVVAGVHGRGAIGRLLFGSTSAQLLRHAGCPVLTLRAGKPA
jgi:nucleotide-binding universal stress UspA family protein